MADLKLGGNPIHTNGNLPTVGNVAPEFTLTKKDLSSATLADYKGSKVILNIFPSIDTGVCAISVRKFNEAAASLENTKVLCISRDLPFAQGRFCGAEGVDNVEVLSDFVAGQFGKDYGLEMTDGALQNLHARVVMTLDESGKVLHSELVDDIANEPNYEAALSSLK